MLTIGNTVYMGLSDAQYLKNIRNALHLTQKEMADRLGYAEQGSISRIEQGHTDMIPQARAHLKTIEKHEIDQLLAIIRG